MRSRPKRTHVPVAILVVLAFGIELDAEAPVRSSYYDGSSWVSYPDDPAFEPAGDFTIEAWVWRQDNNRCETVASKNFNNSWWFGFCGRPRFYTANSQFVDADRNIPSSQWYHVAVVVESTGKVDFYIDGEPAGGGALPPVAHNDSAMVIGANVDGRFPLQGRIDELRMWHRALSDGEIRANRFKELQSGDDLVAVFADGGLQETLAGLTREVRGDVVADPFGVLPRNLRIPRAKATPSFDGLRGINEYAGAEQMVIRFHSDEAARDAVARLVHDDEYLYVVVESLRSPEFEDRRLLLLFDPNRTSDGELTPDEKAVELFPDGLFGSCEAQRYRGASDGSGLVDCADAGDCPKSSLFDGAVGPSCVVGPSCLEYRVARSLLGVEDSVFGLALQYAEWDGKGLVNVALSPSDAVGEDPTTWALAELVRGGETPGGSGSCADPFEVPAQGPFPFERTDDFSNSANGLEGAECLPLSHPGCDGTYHFVPAESGRYRISVRSPEGGDVAILLGLSCPFDDDGCLAASDAYAAGDPEVLEAYLEEQTTYFVFVDGRHASDPGTVTLRVERLGPIPSRVVDFATLKPEDLEPARQLMDIWEEDENKTRLLGSMREDNYREFLSLEGGVRRFESTKATFEPSPPRLVFDRFRHDVEAGHELILALEVDLAGLKVEQTVWVVGGDDDIEAVKVRVSGGRFETIDRPELVIGGDAISFDGVLTVKQGGSIVAVWQDPRRPFDSTATATAVAMVAGHEPSGAFRIEIDGTLQPPVPTTPGRAPNEENRPLGVIAGSDGTSAILGTDQLLFQPRSEADFVRFVARYGARTVGVVLDGNDSEQQHLLMRVDLEKVDVGDVEVMLELLGGSGTLSVSSPELIPLLWLAAEERLRGSNLTPNLVAEFYGQPGSFEEEVPPDPRFDAMTFCFDRDDMPDTCNAVMDCVMGLQRAWMYTAIYDREKPASTGVRVGVIDTSFCADLANDADVVGGWDFFNDRAGPFGDGPELGLRQLLLFHGTGMASLIGARHNNQRGAGGAGGQVADLLLYNVGGTAYLSDAARAVDRAVGDRARVINMSFGFPCRVEGVNFCNAEGVAFCLFAGPAVDAALVIAAADAGIPLPPEASGPGACWAIVGFLNSSSGALESAVNRAVAADVVCVAASGHGLDIRGYTPR